MTNSIKNKDAAGDYSVKPPAQARNELTAPVIELTIPADYAGLRLDQALAKLLPDWSRSRLQTWIGEDRVTLDGVKTSVKQKVWGNEHIRILPQDSAAESVYTAEAISLTIVYEDDALIVVNNPAGLVTHQVKERCAVTLLNGFVD